MRLTGDAICMILLRNKFLAMVDYQDDRPHDESSLKMNSLKNFEIIIFNCLKGTLIWERFDLMIESLLNTCTLWPLKERFTWELCPHICSCVKSHIAGLQVIAQVANRDCPTRNRPVTNLFSCAGSFHRCIVLGRYSNTYWPHVEHLWVKLATAWAWVVI